MQGSLLAEVLRFFPAVDAELAEALLLSSDDVGTVLEGLGVKQLPVPVADTTRVGTPLLLDAPTTVVGPQGQQLGTFQRLFVCERFGSYRLNGREVLASSPSYEYAVACDNVTDHLYFASWDGVFGERLETALVELLAACDDSLAATIGSLTALSEAVMGPGAGAELTETGRMVTEDLAKALVDHSQAAMGRLHATLHQLLQVSRMFPLPPVLVNAIKSFESAKNTTGAVRAAVLAASAALDDYGMAAMTSGGLGANDSHIRQLLLTKATLVKTAETGDLSHLWSFAAVGQTESMGSDPWRPHPVKVAVFPVLPLDAVLNPSRCAPLIDVYTETLAGGGVLMVGSFLQHRMATCTPQHNASVIAGLVACGLGYAGSGSGGALVGLHGHSRACIFLTETPIVHNRLSSRRKDCCRQIRKVARERPSSRLSLRVNSCPLHEAVCRLREHHSESNWVDAHMEAAWSVLLEQGRFVVYELWEDDQLLAADFCHLVPGGSVYVATRYSDRGKGALSPGFLLALLEAKHLQSAGYAIWDLGQTDSNPMMSYKEVVAHVMPRSRHLQRFRQLGSGEAQGVKSGVLIEAVKETDLLEVK
jgi:Leu/Phe-tRNA-protein transferase